MHDAAASLAHAQPHPYWLDSVPLPPALPRLTGQQQADLTVIGAGFCGLWTALQARQRWPQARIVVLEAQRCGSAASSRNGGFCAPSISHGVGNALRRWPAEAEALIRLGRQNLDEFQADLEHLGLEVEFERRGKLNVAREPWQVEGLQQMQRNYQRFGIDCELLEGPALSRYLDSPHYACGLFEPNYALLNPQKLVLELRRACLAAGIEIHEHSPVQQIGEDGAGLRLRCPLGEIQARHVALATNVYTDLLPRLRNRVIPVYDYALTSEPLSPAQLAAIGWHDRYGIADAGNQFHYLRRTADNRILWGGYDAIYPFASRVDERLTQRPETFLRLAEQFFEVFPSLRGLSFSHAWGGIIDTSARTTLFTGRAFDGRLAYALGFTGQGVSATRFAAGALLDLLEGRDSERTRLRMLSRRPVPFPPEPLRYLGVRLAQRDLAAEDRHGRRSLLLRGLDACGVGFDS